MRVLKVGAVASSLLWAATIWCFLVLRVATGHNHFHLSAHDFGASLLGIDLAFLGAFVWIDRQLRDPS
ncbi:MAG: hypothetical protein ACRYGP_08275 [Janthinobacterium lividum]